MVQVKKKHGPQQRDFKKVKAKGYGKAKPKANVVNTTLKTRALMMPYQKVADGSRLDREEVTKRNLSLDELLSKVGHHNAKARRDTLQGMRELLSEHPHLLHARLGQTLRAVLEGLTRAGENEQTDGAVVGVLRTILAAVPPEKMSPHGAVVAAYLMSAFTHLRVQSRMLGVRVLDACLEYCPAAILQAMDLHQLLSSLAATLTNRFQSGLAASAALTRQKLWSTVLTVLRCSQGTTGSVEATVRVLHTNFPPFRSLYNTPRGVVAALVPLDAGVRIANLLMPLLMQDLFEAIPGTDLDLMEALLEALAWVAVVPRHLCTSVTQDCMVKTLNHIAAQFPVSREFSIANARAAAVLLSSGNAQWAQIVSSPGGASEMLSQPGISGQARMLLLRACEQLWMSSAQAFGGEAGLVMAEAFLALFRTRLSAAVRAECTTGLAFLLDSPLTPEHIREALLGAAAKCLWQCVGAKSSESTDEAAAGVLGALWCHVRRYDGSDLLSRLLVPFFSVQVQEKVHYGPFAKLSERCQVAAVQLYAGMNVQAATPLRDAWIRALVDPSTHEAAAVALVRVIHTRRRSLFESIRDYLSFLVEQVLGALHGREKLLVTICCAVRDAGLADGVTAAEQHLWLYGTPSAKSFDNDGAAPESTGMASLRAMTSVLQERLNNAAQSSDGAFNALLLAAVCAPADGRELPSNLLALIPNALGVTLSSRKDCGVLVVQMMRLPSLLACLATCLVSLASNEVVDASISALVRLGVSTVDPLAAIALLRALPGDLRSQCVEAVQERFEQRLHNGIKK